MSWKRQYTVEYRAFSGDDGTETRKVYIPMIEDLSDLLTIEILNLVFLYGQNEFQPIKNKRSVSVGDVIIIDENRKYQVDQFGFTPYQEEKN